MVATERRKWLALALLSAVQFMVVLDIAIVNVALPSIKIDLGFSQQNLQWVISAYMLSLAAFLIPGGRLGDILGRRRILMVGLVIFGLSSLGAALVPNAGTVIAFRELTWRFSKPVFIGDTVHMTAEVARLKPLPRLGGGSVVFKVKVTNQRKEVVARGEWNLLMASAPQAAAA